MKANNFQLLICLVSFWSLGLFAQDCTELAPTISGISILGDILGSDEQQISGACRLAKGSDYYSVRIAHQGFDDKEYRIIGQVLNANRRRIPGCEPVVKALGSTSTSTDLTFRFATGSGKGAGPEVRFLKVSIVESDDPIADLNLNGLSLTGTSAEYRVDHQFLNEAGGPENVERPDITVSVSLTPVGRAIKIKQ